MRRTSTRLNITIEAIEVSTLSIGLPQMRSMIGTVSTTRNRVINREVVIWPTLMSRATISSLIDECSAPAPTRT